MMRQQTTASVCVHINVTLLKTVTDYLFVGQKKHDKQTISSHQKLICSKLQDFEERDLSVQKEGKISDNKIKAHLNTETYR